ncbi:MAG: ABC transporter permease [Deinococcales bacterium]
MKTILHIAIAEARHVWKQPHLIAMLFVLPIVFSSILGLLQSSDIGPVRVLITRPNTPQAIAFENQLRTLGADVESAGIHAQSLVTTAYRDAWLKLPPDFDTRFLLLAPQQLELMTSAGNPRVWDVLQRVRAAYIRLQAPLIAAKAVPNSNAAARAADLLKTDLVKVVGQKVEVANSRVLVTSGAEQIAPGMTLMFALLFGAQAGLAFLRERTSGTLARLFAAPVSRVRLVLGKLLGNTMVLGGQLAVMVLFSSLALGVRWGNPVALILPCTAFAFAAAAFGALCAALTKTAAQFGAFSVLSVNVLSALGGLWWPIEVTPTWMQQIAQFLPTYWGLQAMQNVILKQASVWQLLPHTAILLGFAALFVAVGSRAFRYE